MNPFGWINRVIGRHPFMAVLVALLLVVVPGFYRIEDTASDAQRAADQNEELLAAMEARDERDIEARRAEELQRCRDRNSATALTRQAFMDVFDVIEELEVDPAAVRQLRAAVPEAIEQDLDCTQDGRLDEDDYAADFLTRWFVATK